MKKIYTRQYPRFSLCGLNCGLCPQFHSDGAFQCPGCGGEAFYEKHPSCAVISCAQRHGGVEYCFQCEDYPCEKYAEVSPYDSFITYRNVLKDFEKAEKNGLVAYQLEMDEKVEILRVLLDVYNDGRRKTFFCTAVNLLSLEDVREALTRIADEVKDDLTLKEKAAIAVRIFQSIAEQRDISLKLNRKKSK